MTISEEALLNIAQSSEMAEREIASLKRQLAGVCARNAVLVEEKNELELRLSVRCLGSDVKLWERAESIERRLVAFEQAANRLDNRVQGLPTREEFELLKNDYYAHSAGCS